jgi:hypothetical protein
MTNATDGGGKPLLMTVDKVSFLLDRLGQDCSPPSIPQRADAERD